jgi:hypothetical protein
VKEGHVTEQLSASSPIPARIGGGDERHITESAAGTLDSPSRAFVRIGGIAAIVGCLIFMVANVLHPRSSDIADYREQIETVGASGIWVVDHLVFLLGVLLMTAGLLALGRYLAGHPRSAPWARLGDTFAIISAAVVGVLIALDGLASKEVHQAAVEAAPAARTAYFAAAQMMETIDASLFSIWICTFFGVTFGLYAAAVLVGRQFAPWTGWVAAAAAAAALVLGVIQGVDGLSKLVTNQLFVLTASTLNTWLLFTAIALVRRERAAALPGGAPAAMSPATSERT